MLDELVLQPDANSESPYGPRLINAAGAELSYQFANDDSMIVWYTPPSGTPVALSRVQDLGGGTIAHELQGTESLIRNVNGSVKLQSDVGSAVELGDTAGLGVRIVDGRLELTSTSVSVLSGNGSPSVAAPNGSIYLRVDGDVGSTFYVREGGSWVAK